MQKNVFENVRFLDEGEDILNEAMKYPKNIKFVKKDQVPESFKKTIYDIVDLVEGLGFLRKPRGGKNNGAKTLLLPLYVAYSKKIKEKVAKEDLNAAYISIPQEVRMDFTTTIPTEYTDHAGEILGKAGFKAGKKLPGNISFYHMGKIGTAYYKKDKTKDGEDCYFIAYVVGKRTPVSFGINNIPLLDIDSRIDIRVDCVKDDSFSKKYFGVKD